MIKKYASRLILTSTMLLIMFLILHLQTTPSFASDTTPPALVNLEFNPTTIDTRNGSQDVVFTWTLTDDIGGLASDGYSSSPTQLRITSPSGQQSVDSVVESSSTLVSGDLNDGTFVDTVTFPQFSEAGTWQISYVMLVDTLDNSQILSTSQS